jgi:GSH-dependent disulfide-bond oxidoreductase
LVGEEYTIADIAWWPWVRCIRTGYDAWEVLDVPSYTNVVRWLETCEARPASTLGLKVNSGADDGAFKEYHSPDD